MAAGLDCFAENCYESVPDTDALLRHFNTAHPRMSERDRVRYHNATVAPFNLAILMHTLATSQPVTDMMKLIGPILDSDDGARWFHDFANVNAVVGGHPSSSTSCSEYLSQTHEHDAGNTTPRAGRINMFEPAPVQGAYATRASSSPHEHGGFPGAFSTANAIPFDFGLPPATRQDATVGTNGGQTTDCAEDVPMMLYSVSDTPEIPTVAETVRKDVDYNRTQHPDPRERRPHVVTFTQRCEQKSFLSLRSLLWFRSTKCATRWQHPCELSSPRSGPLRSEQTYVTAAMSSATPASAT